MQSQQRVAKEIVKRQIIGLRRQGIGGLVYEDIGITNNDDK
jgi:hypothetical protein